MIEVIITLLLTILLEFGVYSIFIRKNYKKNLLYSMFINGITNPLANMFWFLSMNLQTWQFPRGLLLIIIEVIVILVEIPLIILLTKQKLWKAIVISIIANIISFILGFFIIFLAPYFFPFFYG